MAIQEFDREEWEDTLVRSNEVRLIEFITSEQIIKTVAWFVIGGTFIYLAISQLLSVHNVPLELLFLLFLGQGLFAFGGRYLKKISWPARRYYIPELKE